MNEFDAEAATWDDKPARAARVDAVVAGIKARISLSTTMSVLEFGAGTGAVGRMLAPEVGRVICLDSSPGMVEVAREKIAAGRHHNVEALRGELCEVQGRFDLIVASMVLHHVGDVPGALVRFADLLALGGHVAIIDLDEDVHREYHAEGFGGHHGFVREVLAHDLERVGVTDLRWDTVFHMRKTAASGAERTFALFLVTGRRAR